MLANIHVLQALERGWKLLQVNRPVWREWMQNMPVTDGVVTEKLADQWFDAICGKQKPDAPASVHFVDAYVHGETQLPCVCVTIGRGSPRQQEETMGANSEDGACTDLPLTIQTQIWIYGRTIETVAPVSLALLGILTQAQAPWFNQTLRYRNVRFDGLQDLVGSPEQMPEHKGVMRRVLTWTMVQDLGFTPLVPNESAGTIWSLAPYDNVDRTGQPGKVTIIPP